MVSEVIIFDFGSQYTQLIARRVREQQVFCEILPYHKIDELDTREVSAVILSGSPFSVNQENALKINLNKILGKYPVLGICYGAQLLVHETGGNVTSSDKREYGKAELQTIANDPIWTDISDNSQIWMSHADSVEQLPQHFELLAKTDSIPVAAFKAREGKYNKPVYGFQFHPEVTHSINGARLISNFLFEIAGVEKNWNESSFIEETVAKLKQQIGDSKVVMGLSGGVDSTVAAKLIHNAVGDQLTCLFVDNGLLRHNEFDQVLDSYKDMGFNIKGLRKADSFLDALKGESDPQTKRKIIGRVFIEAFTEAALAIDEVKYLGQGTIYPDVIESISVKGPSAEIKSHHNVGGLPEDLPFDLVEPLRMLFKDEVRKIGLALGIDPDLIGRHPFPGPGLSIRILGDITKEKVALCQKADDIFISKLKSSGLYDKVWQAGAILLPVNSVGVMGDERTYEQTIALRCVNSVDGMTAEWSPLPYEFLAEVSNEIINKVKGINRVVYDISTKPPATIEWE